MLSSTNPEKLKPERERQDWGIVLIILLMGFLCVIVAAQWALRLSPTWTLNADMGSNLDLNSEFLTRKPVVFFEPVDPAILTQPAWVNGNVFLTPGVSYSTVTPLPPLTSTVSTEPETTLIPTNTLAVTNTSTAVPTNTLVWLPLPATATRKPRDTDVPPPNTSPPPSIDLQVTKDDGTATSVAGGTLTYTIVVTNAGPGNVTGATVTDTFPAQISGAGWTCAGAGGGVCTTSGAGHINDSVNLPAGSSVTYTVNVNIHPSASGNLVNTASVGMPAGYIESNPANNTSTDTDTPVVIADLWIMKDDSATAYVAGGTLTYTVTVGNAGPSNVIGAVITDNINLAQIASWDWACAQYNGANGCDAITGSNANFSDTVDLPSGASIIYTVTAHISGGPSGNVANTATIGAPASYTDPPGNNSATDPNPDILITTVPTPGQIGTSPGGGVYTVPTGGALTLNTNIVVDGDVGVWDLIYYELPVGAGGIDMDQVIIQISDGYNWYTILNWGNGSPDNNTNIGGFSPEDDNYHINPGDLYNSTGVAIDLDGMGIPTGTYSYIRITAPAGDTGNDGCDIDAIDTSP